MNLREKILYHQIHPVKLFTDICAAVLALYLLWQRRFGTAILVAFVPPLIVSVILVRMVNLEKYKQSSFGMYINKYMSGTIEMIRLAGFAVMAVGSWRHIIGLLPFGLLIILLAWLRGVMFPMK